MIITSVEVQEFQQLICKSILEESEMKDFYQMNP